MKIKQIACALLLAFGLSANAANTINKVSQVSTEVTLTDNVDYIITNDKPFADGGKVNITNTEHAVLIIQSIRPSLVIKNHLKDRVFINGEQAVNGENCQVKMYAHGAIIMPYAKDIAPLTVYSEPDFGGTAVSDFGLEHSGGFMNTLTDAKLNNQIRSFKLKRGYMVTFATGKSGWGYSRCFIADKEDLEFAELPVHLDGRISSYRVFQWYDAEKKGLASDTRQSANDLLGSSWCYDWATGFSHLPDRECVPHQIYVAWPSASSCGSATYACHMKTNNEPGNSADDTPQSVEVILNQWQELMRTGLRLCSESSHDGSWAHLDEFIAAVDARGWRCDILDLHCYWASGFDNMQHYYNKYGKRPIWISEFVWGASWNNNGIFSEKRHIPVTPKNVIDALNDPNNTDEFEWLKIVDGKETYIPITNPNEVKTDNSVQYFKNGRSFSQTYQQANLNAMTGIFNTLNNSPYVERYAYWNSEADCSKLLRGESELSLTGKYFQTMQSGMAYRKEYEKIPNVVYTAPSNVKGSWANQSKGFYKITWDDTNGDMLEEIRIERRLVGEEYATISTIQPMDQTSKIRTYTYQDTLTKSGEYEYRVAYTTAEGKTLLSKGALKAAKSSVQYSDKIQYGEFLVINFDDINVKYVSPFEESPIVFIGTPTDNSEVQYGNLITYSNESEFTYAPYPWVTSSSAFQKSESIPFMAIMKGNYKFSQLDCEVGTSKRVKINTEDSVSFTQPFPAGVVPVVLTEINNPTSPKSAMMVKVWNITKTGFRFKIMKEEDAVASNFPYSVSYLAITPGVGAIDDTRDLKIAAGRNDEVAYGPAARKNLFLHNSDTLHFINPFIFANLQSNKYDAAVMLRRRELTELEIIDGVEYTIGARFKRVVDPSRGYASDGTQLNQLSMKDDLGWVVIYGTGEETSGIIEVEEQESLRPYVVGNSIRVDGDEAFDVYTMQGMKIASPCGLAAGVYIVRTAKSASLVVVR